MLQIVIVHYNKVTQAKGLNSSFKILIQTFLGSGLTFLPKEILQTLNYILE